MDICDAWTKPTLLDLPDRHQVGLEQRVLSVDMQGFGGGLMNHGQAFVSRRRLRGHLALGLCKALGFVLQFLGIRRLVLNLCAAAAKELVFGACITPNKTFLELFVV